MKLIDEVQCYQTVRDIRWPDGIACPSCQSKHVIKRGCDDTEPARQRYECHDCDQRFDDLTDPIFAGQHQPLQVWVLGLYCMGLKAAPGKFESKKLCSDQRVTARCVAGNFHIFVVLYCGEPHDADAHTALSR